MQFNKVEICGVNTAKLKVLTEAEKGRLLRLVHEQGDMQAREELIAGNLRLVLSVIQRFTNRGENPDDLFQVGCIGLMKSIDNFDITQNVRFSTYAVPVMIEIRKKTEDYPSFFRYSSSLKKTRISSCSNSIFSMISRTTVCRSVSVIALQVPGNVCRS